MPPKAHNIFRYKETQVSRGPPSKNTRDRFRPTFHHTADSRQRAGEGQEQGFIRTSLIQRRAFHGGERGPSEGCGRVVVIAGTTRPGGAWGSWGKVAQRTGATFSRVTRGHGGLKNGQRDLRVYMPATRCGPDRMRGRASAELTGAKMSGQLFGYGSSFAETFRDVLPRRCAAPERAMGFP